MIYSELCSTCNRPMVLMGQGWTCFRDSCSMFGVIMFNTFIQGQVIWTDDIKPKEK